MSAEKSLLEPFSAGEQLSQGRKNPCLLFSPLPPISSLSESILPPPPPLWPGKHLIRSLGSRSRLNRPKTGFSLLHQRLTKTGRPPAEILVVMEATGI